MLWVSLCWAKPHPAPPSPLCPPQGLGVQQEQVGRMLQHCPALFSWAAQERAAVLVAELLSERVGLSARQAAELFVACPALANTHHVMPSLVKMVAAHHADSLGGH